MSDAKWEVAFEPHYKRSYSSPGPCFLATDGEYARAFPVADHIFPRWQAQRFCKKQNKAIERTLSLDDVRARRKAFEAALKELGQ